MRNINYLVIGNTISQCKLEEITGRYIKIKVADKTITVTNFKKGRFYLFSYEAGLRVILTNKWWQSYPAIMIENMRNLLQ